MVGVAPQGFTGITALQRPRIFVPLAMAEQAFRDPAWNGTSARNNHWLYLFARTEPGVSRERAEGLANVSFAGLTRDVEYPALRSGMGDTDRQEFQKRRLYLQDGARGANSNRRTIQAVFALLFAVTGFVLAIACANVANIMLAQVTTRAREMSVRLSLGASRYRVVRLLLTEATLLGILGGAGALVVGQLTMSAMVAILPADGPVLRPGTRRTPARVHALAWTTDEPRVRALSRNACRGHGARGRREYAYRSSLGLESGRTLSHVDGRHATGARDGIARRRRLARGESGEHRSPGPGYHA